MGLSAVVDNLRALKQSVKKPIVAFRDTVHTAYTKVYVGSPERIDEFYEYIKVYSRSDHNDLCMMSITADINRFTMIPDKHTFFHVLKLERHFDRMIAAKNKTDVNGDMAIQILSGHNMSFMDKYRRYKTRAAAKESKRNAKRHKALNSRRLHALGGKWPQTDNLPEENGINVVAKSVEVEDDKELEELTKEIREVVVLPKKEVSVVCELTNPETVVAAPLNAVEPTVQKTISCAGEKKLEKEVKKRRIGNKSKVVEKTVSITTTGLLEDVMEQLNTEKDIPSTSIAAPKLKDDSSDNDEFDNLSCSCSSSSSSGDDDNDSSDGSDIEELEGIDEKDVDALEYEII
uniref:Uncharacterized protein n=1 Tax=Caenorhabditis japonica TaxID=281687 RepID=A0A8R1DF88_CAEJA